MMRILLPVSMVCLLACTTAHAATADKISVGGKCARDGSISTNGPNGTGIVLTCEDSVWRAPPTAFGAVTFNMPGGRVYSQVVGIGGNAEALAFFKIIPYTASVSITPGKSPVKTTSFVHDGISGAIRAIGQLNGRVALKIDLMNTTLTEMGHYTSSDGMTIDTPKTNSQELHGTLDLVDGQSAPLEVDGKTIGSVSWNSINPASSAGGAGHT